MTLQKYLIPYILSQAAAVVLIFVCFKWPRAGKIVWGIIFTAAGVFNMYQALTNPGIYAKVYGETAFLAVYKDFIYGVFQNHAALFVGLIASGQILTGILLWMRSTFHKLGILGGIVFLAAISPLGVGSAFPATLLMAFSLVLILLRWKRKKEHHE
ncbi:MAG: hypothetical protein JXB26_16915 [Candidatus Aminicenantes bacterium]|nr:hypothetical protein [Candidatus Aminicenantes bacterium]